MNEQVDYVNILRDAAESLVSEGRYNQASVIADVADAFAALRAERDGLLTLAWFIDDRNDVCPACDMIHAHADTCDLAAAVAVANADILKQKGDSDVK